MINKNIEILVLFIILIIIISTRYKEHFVNLDTVNNSYGATQNLVKDIFNDITENDAKSPKNIHGKNFYAQNQSHANVIKTNLIKSRTGNDLKLHSYPIHMDGGVAGWGGDFNFNRLSIKQNGELCLDGVCINKEHLKMLTGDRKVKLRHDHGGGAYLASNNDRNDGGIIQRLTHWATNTNPHWTHWKLQMV